jgi:putative membrane protein
MQSSPSPEPEPYNLNNELAKERTRAAADRTLMAWIRTSLSLIGFGFGIPAIIKTIEATRIGKEINPHYSSTIIGLSFITIGTLAMLFALKDHRRILKQIARGHYTYESSDTAEVVGVALMLVGVFSFVGVLIKALNL